MNADLDSGCHPSTSPGLEDLPSRAPEATRRRSTPVPSCSPACHGSSCAFERYLRDLAAYPVMGAEEELQAAKTIERTEIEHWVALLSFLPVAASVLERLWIDIQTAPEDQRSGIRLIEQLQALARRCDMRPPLPPPYASEWRDRAHELARSIRLLDADRVWMSHARRTAIITVERESKGKRTSVSNLPGYREFLSHVAETERVQRQAKHRFVEANLRLVVTVARRYPRGGLPFIDVVQEGNIGLIKAVERFDHTRGYRFSTFALWWIRHAITRALSEKGRAVRVPEHLLSAHARASRAMDVLKAQTGIEPSLDDVERQTRLSPKKLRKIALLNLGAPVSFDTEMVVGSVRRIGETIEDSPTDPYHCLEQKCQSQELQQLLKILTPCELRLIRWRFGLDDDELTLAELGQRYQLSREAIRRRLLKTLRKMRRRWALAR